MESYSQPQKDLSSPQSLRNAHDVLENELSRLNARFLSLLQTPPRKHAKVMETPSPSPPAAVPLLAEPTAVSLLAETVAAPEQKQLRCRYCDEIKTTETLRSHQDNCEKRQIECEACREMVEIDIFDFHMEICPSRPDPYAMYQGGNGLYENFYAEMGINVHGEEEPPLEELEASNNNQENQEDDGEAEEQEEGENEDEHDPAVMEFDGVYGMDPDLMTYEQLIVLDSNIVKKGVTTDELKAFPVKMYLKALDGPCSCAICISECESAEMLRELPCGHRFHKECIDTWLDENITCPVCKKYLR